MINLEKYGLTKENVLYLPIKRIHFDRILKGTKRLEFRELSDHYYKRLFFLNKDGSIKGDKPLKVILFSAGYSKDVPRMLIELKDWRLNDPEYRKEHNTKPNPQYEEWFKEEGFDIYKDLILFFVLGKVLETENL